MGKKIEGVPLASEPISPELWKKVQEARKARERGDCLSLRQIKKIRAGMKERPKSPGAD